MIDLGVGQCSMTCISTLYLSPYIIAFAHAMIQQDMYMRKCHRGCYVSWIELGCRDSDACTPDLCPRLK